MKVFFLSWHNNHEVGEPDNLRTFQDDMWGYEVYAKYEDAVLSALLEAFEHSAYGSYKWCEFLGSLDDQEKSFYWCDKWFDVVGENETPTKEHFMQLYAQLNDEQKKRYAAGIVVDEFDEGQHRNNFRWSVSTREVLYKAKKE